jgi:hypothetical protein
MGANSDNRRVDPVVLAVVIAVITPIGVIWALSKAASLRGPAPRPEGRVPIQTLVTEAIPEEHPKEDDDSGDGPALRIDSMPDQPSER